MDKAELIKALRERMAQVPPLPDEPDFATSEETLVLYLKSVGWKYKDAERYLLQTVEYRRATQPLRQTTCNWCYSKPGYHSMRQVGHDEAGRPVIYSCFSQAAVRKNKIEDTVSHVTYVIENAKPTMGPGVTTWVFVLDCSGMTVSACNPRLGIGVSHTLSDHYPERLGLVICVNHNPLFQAVYRAMKKVVRASVMAKVRLVQTDAKIRQTFSTYFSDELTDWLMEEIHLNKQKHLTESQREFWVPPKTTETVHDPRGSPSYIQKYVNTFKPRYALLDVSLGKRHCPHPNIIDTMTYEATVPTGRRFDEATVSSGRRSTSTWSATYTSSTVATSDLHTVSSSDDELDDLVDVEDVGDYVDGEIGDGVDDVSHGLDEDIVDRVDDLAANIAGEHPDRIDFSEPDPNQRDGDFRSLLHNNKTLS